VSLLNSWIDSCLGRRRCFGSAAPRAKQPKRPPALQPPASRVLRGSPAHKVQVTMPSHRLERRWRVEQVAALVSGLAVSSLFCARLGSATPIIEPQLRRIANATSNHQPIPAGLQRYASMTREGGDQMVQVFLEGTVDRG